MNQKGFASIIVIIGVVILAGAAGYFIVNRQNYLPTPTPITSPTPSPAPTPSTANPSTLTPKPTPKPNPTSISPTDNSQIIKGHSASGKSIKVTLMHDKSNPYALNDDFAITNNTHIAVSLSYAPYAEGPSETVLSQDFFGIEKLPFLFSIAGALDKTFKDRSGYYLSAKVFKHSGNEVVIGDLVSEISTPVGPNDSNIEIKVFGMEDCGAPYSGGFCTTKK